MEDEKLPRKRVQKEESKGAVENVIATTKREVDNLLEQKQDLELQLRSRQSELMSMALILVQIKDILNDCAKRLSTLIQVEEKPDIKQGLKSIVKTLQNEANSKKEWTLFETQLKMLNEPFVEKLCSDYPSLSNQEIRIAALLKAGLNTKDIAGLFSIQVRTVENHRFSIRKKMGIHSDRDLVLELQKII